jgi:hypothetical protein
MKNIAFNDKVNRAIKKYGYEPNELAAELEDPPHEDDRQNTCSRRARVGFRKSR